MNEIVMDTRAGVPGSASRIGWSEFEFRLIRDYIHDFCGIYYDDFKSDVLMSRLSFRMKLLGIGSYHEYYNYLKFNPNSKKEADDLVPHLTNNETYFFREINPVGFLVSRIQKRIASGPANGDRTIRILSCGCSSGEEAFTTAILLEEAGVYRSGWKVELTGIDIDRKILEKASMGEYSSYSLRAAERAKIERYFQKESEKYYLDSRIRNRVRFRRGNLMDKETFSDLSGMDAILCRNVFIYFSDDAIRRAVNLFYECLSDSGLLLLGHSESLTRITDVFYAARFPGIIVYSKKELEDGWEGR